jgi:hypothetical protein
MHKFTHLGMRYEQINAMPVPIAVIPGGDAPIQPLDHPAAAVVAD